MKINSLTGVALDLQEEQIEAFQMTLRGPVMRPGDAGYEEIRTVWNAIIDRKPAIIVRCLGTADIIACVKFAREHNLLLCIKGGGHNIAGLGVADGALMLDMSLMRGVFVDPEHKVAHVQPGCVLGDIDRETQLHGLAAVLGFVSLTGAVSLTMGGGLGYLTKRWGWASDSVLAMNIVTAEGQLVRASEDENPELFWALRGGGGNFGVVTGVDYKLYPVGPEVVGGLIAWPASEAPKVLDFYRKVAAEAPPELTVVTLMRLAPPAPWLPKDYHGKPIIAILTCYSGDPAQGEEIVAPIKAFGSPIGDVMIRRPYVQLQSMLDATQPKGRRYYWKSEYLPGIEPDLCNRFMAHAEKIPSPHSALIFFQLEGALNNIANNHSSVGNRDARYVLNIAGSWEDENDDEANIAWARTAWDDMKSFSTGGTYINFLTADEGPERNEAALGVNIKRLAEIKAKWDPDNIFRTNRNIAPVK